MICQDCNREVKRLEFHHDPPRSRRFKENGTEYFVDTDNKKKMVMLHQKNRKLCRACHGKANEALGLPTINDFGKKKKYTHAARKLRAGHVLCK